MKRAASRAATLIANSRISLNDLRLVVDYPVNAGSPYATRLSQILAGANRAQDSGPGLIGILQTADYGGASFGGVSVDASSVLLFATLVGDNNAIAR